MRFLTRLFVFAVALTVGLSIYKGVNEFRHQDGDRVIVKEVRAADIPEPPALAEAPEPPEPPTARVMVAVDAPTVVRLAPREQVRILTTNRAAFLSLRDDKLVAGLSDSIRDMVTAEMKKETSRHQTAGVGQMIGDAVRSGVEKLLDKEIAVPVSDIRDITYKRDRIVIVYKGGDAPGLVNLETIKGDGDRTLLQQFSEADARRLVEAVKVRIR